MAIKKKPNGRWVVDYRIGTTRYRPEFDNRDQAEEFDRTRRLSKTHVVETQMKISDAIAKYQTDFSAAKDSACTEKAFFKRLEDHLVNREALTFIHEVKYSHLKSLQNRIKAVKAPATVNRHFNTYKHFFKEAIRQGWRVDSPAVAIEALPVESEITFKPWDKDAQELFLASCEAAWMKRMAKAFFITGQRPSTIGRWTWADIDFTKGVIKGRQKKGKGGWINFEIPMSQSLKALLLEMRKDAIVGMNVFINTIGNPVTINHFKRQVSIIMNRTGLSEAGYKFYDRRHEIATLVSASHGLDVASNVLGHKSQATTKKYYAKGDIESAKKALDALEVSASLDTYGHQ